MIKSNLGILVVHMQGATRSDWTHESGFKKSGINAVRRVLETASSHSIPIYLSQHARLSGNQDIIPEVLDSAGSRAVQFYSDYDSFNSFGLDFKERLKKDKVERLGIFGFNRLCCVYEAAKSARKNKIPFFTSRDTLFGNKKYDEILDEEIETVMYYYETAGKLYDSHRSLIIEEID